MMDTDEVDRFLKDVRYMNKATAAHNLSKIIARQVREARIEQIMQDFLSLIDLPDNFEEQDLIEWRTDRLAELRAALQAAQPEQTRPVTVVEYQPDALRVVINDVDRATWLDGSKLYYAMPRDYRPDINPFDLEDVYQSYYALDKLTGRKTGKEMNDVLDTLKQLADIYVAYAYHVLGLLCQEQGNDLELKGSDDDTE